MAINPQIPLMARGIDLQQVLLGGLQSAQTLQSIQQAAAEAPLRQQVLEQSIQAKQMEADILKAGITASRFKPFIANKDYEGFSKELQQAGLDPEDGGILDTYARANRWDAINTVADQYIQTARDAGVLGKDTAATSGYTPSAITLFERLKELQVKAENLPEGPAKEKALADAIAFENIIRAPQSYGAGGNMTAFRTGITGQTSIGDIDPTRAMGAGAPPSPPSPTGTGAVDQSVLNQPIEGGAAASRASTVTTRTTEDIAAEIARRNAQLQTATTAGEKEAIRMGDYEKDIQNHRSLRRGLDAVFADEGLEGLFKDLPEGKLSSAVNNAVSTFMGGTKGKDAEGRIGQLSRMIIAGVPYDPGAQSNAELQAREALVGALNDQNISVNEKIKSIKRYFRFVDERNQSAKETLSDFYERNPAINAPSWFRTQQLSQPRENAATPMTSGQPTFRYVPGQGLMRIGGQ